MVENVMTEDLIAFVREQRDRQEIHDCLLRYTRGVDRHDRELMLSAYHSDAYDDHGVAQGVARDFGDWAIAYRVCVNEKAGLFVDGEIPVEWLDQMRSTGPDRRDSQDISYRRPLRRDAAGHPCPTAR